MKKIAMLGSFGALAMASVLGSASLAGGQVIVPDAPPKPKRKRRAKAVRKISGKNEYSRSYYTPAGENQNCGFKGISPKSFDRAAGRS